MYSSIKLNGLSYDKTNLSDFIELAPTLEDRLFYTEIASFLEEWFDETDTVLVHTSGSTGEPKPMHLQKQHMINSAKLTCSFFNLSKDSSALLCMPVRYIAGKMMLVRAIVSQLSLTVVLPTSRPLKNTSTVFDFIAVVPLQLYTSLNDGIDVEKLNACRKILVGGGAISTELLTKIQQLNCDVYSSYGMTETVSHIALRKLNGSDASDFYQPLPHVRLSLSNENTLVIDAPLISVGILSTNDIVEFNKQGGFKVLGRTDNIINSGGVKLQTEEIERKLQNLFDFPFVITNTKSARLGDAVSLLLVSYVYTKVELLLMMKQVLTRYELPKHIFYIDEIPLTETKKIDRKACRVLVEKLYNEEI